MPCVPDEAGRVLQPSAAIAHGKTSVGRLAGCKHDGVVLHASSPTEGRDAFDGELRRLGSHWARFWAGCDPLSAADDVRARLDAAVAAWDLDGVEVLAGGVVALVCGARRHGEPVVVKVHPRVTGAEALRFEGDALAFWAHTGAVAGLYDRRDDGFTVLLERLMPGLRLEAVGLGVVGCLSQMGRLAARLHSAGPPPAEWDLPGSTPGPTASAHPVVRAALDRLGDADPTSHEALLHGDLHARNVLLHGTAWRVIDPHGQRGDRHAEVWPLLEASTAFPAEREGDGRLAWTWVEAYAGAAEMDAERVAAWASLLARAQAYGYDAGTHCDDEERAWAAGLHRLADALSR